MALHREKGAGAPTSTPSDEGQHYVDTTNDVLYEAAGVASADDWVRIYGEKSKSPTSSAGTLDIDCDTGNVFDVTLTENTTFTFSNPFTSGYTTSFTLIVRQDGTGSRTVTWPASVKWDGGTTPTSSTAASSIDIFTFFTVDGGTTWFGFAAGLGMA